MVVKLTQQDIADLKRQGFSEQEISKAVQELEREELQGSSQQQRVDPRQKTQTSAFQSGKMEDIARFQLELNDLLEQTEHVLKGDVVKYEGNEMYWDENPNPEKNPLNAEGIRKIMLELQNYINRHIVLGDYDEEDIKVIMKDYGRKVADLLFMKYEEMGMNTDEKRQEYVSIVTNIVNLVYGSYARAKDGGERRSLREMYNVNQNHMSQGMGMPVGVPQAPKTRGVLNPMRYVAGKYV